jgi:DNA polymerase-1
MGYASWKDLPYKAIYVVDTEFYGEDADLKTPVCMVVHELRTGHTSRYWQDELQCLTSAPFDTGPDSLFVSYYAPAELGVFRQLNWAMPERIFDCFAEFSCETNGQHVQGGRSLLAALAYFGLETIEAEVKTDMRDLILEGGPWDQSQQADILDYCQSDVLATADLFGSMIARWIPDEVRLGQALLRGRSMVAVSAIERTGVPIDRATLSLLSANWEAIKLKLIQEVDRDYGVFEKGSFREALFEAYLKERNIPWPRHDGGRLVTDRNTFRAQQMAYPELKALYDLRITLDELRLNDLAVGSDGRNRVMLSPFRSKTGRNQPSTSRFIFGPSTWVRSLIQPTPGYSIAYLDWRSQEIAIAAALSGDERLWEAYKSGDPYMAFAIQTGLAPPGATKASHKAIRDQCKVVVLGIQYGMTAWGMARGSNLLEADAQDLIRKHKETYRVFWAWAERNAAAALFGLPLQTCFGWKIRTGYGTNPKERTFLNWPMQANAAEMLRLACCLATEANLKICAPVHDALLLEAPTSLMEFHISTLKKKMEEASELVLGAGKVCDVEIEVFDYPARYFDERGVEMWSRIMRLLDEAGFAESANARRLIGDAIPF